MNPLTNVKNIQKLNERELQLGIIGKKSWHDEYRESAWVFTGGLPFDLTEGDIICVFSQYGEVVNLNLVRDHKTGKSKGFGFLCYEDQRSTVLAVDNLNGIKVLGRTIRVDHVKDYKMPKDHGDEDEATMKMRDEGCAPKLHLSSEEETTKAEVKLEAGDRKKIKIEKGSKKHRKKKRAASSSHSSGDSDEESSQTGAVKGSSRKQHRKKKRAASSPNSSSVSDEESSQTGAVKGRNRKQHRKKKRGSSSSNSSGGSDREYSQTGAGVEIKQEKFDRGYENSEGRASRHRLKGSNSGSDFRSSSQRSDGDLRYRDSGDGSGRERETGQRGDYGGDRSEANGSQGRNDLNRLGVSGSFGRERSREVYRGRGSQRGWEGGSGLGRGWSRERESEGGRNNDFGRDWNGGGNSFKRGSGQKHWERGNDFGRERGRGQSWDRQGGKDKYREEGEKEEYSSKDYRKREDRDRGRHRDRSRDSRD